MPDTTGSSVLPKHSNFPKANVKTCSYITAYVMTHYSLCTISLPVEIGEVRS